MYGWIWRHLPGPRPLRAVLALLLLVATLVVLFVAVFPALEPLLPYGEVSVE